MRRANFIVKKKKVSTKMVLTMILGLCTLALFKTIPISINEKSVALNAPVEPVLVPVKKTPAETVVVTDVKNDEFAELEKRFKSQTIAGMESMEREKSSKAIRITLNSDVFFQLGTAKLEESSKESIQQIVNILKPWSPVSHIEIEGHTDGSPVIRQKPNYPSNWELSAARAASLIPLFSGNGFFKDQLKVVGYGDSRPLFSNRTSKEVSAKNRRIVLRVFAQEDGIKI